MNRSQAVSYLLRRGYIYRYLVLGKKKMNKKEEKELIKLTPEEKLLIEKIKRGLKIVESINNTPK